MERKWSHDWLKPGLEATWRLTAEECLLMSLTVLSAKAEARVATPPGRPSFHSFPDPLRRLIRLPAEAVLV